jgi:hypothetical protein
MDCASHACRRFARGFPKVKNNSGPRIVAIDKYNGNILILPIRRSAFPGRHLTFFVIRGMFGATGSYSRNVERPAREAWPSLAP